MTAPELITRVTALKLPKNSFIIFGAGPLALAGLREAGDVDMQVTPETYYLLKRRGWKIRVKGPKDKPLVHADFEAHQNWDFCSYQPSFEHLLATATIVDGVPFMALEEVRKWKASDNRPKDLADIELIDAYLKSRDNESITL